MKQKKALIIWIVTKLFALGLWFWLGMWINTILGLWGFIPFVFFFCLLQASDFWNQRLISKATKLLRKQIQQEGLIDLEKKRNLESIQQLEVKRSPLTAVPYLLKRAGMGREPKYLPKPELMDFAPPWIKKHILQLLIIIERYVNPMMLRANLPPIKAAIENTWKNGNIFIGAGIGSGLCNFEKVLANWCAKKGISALIFALDNQPEIIEKAFKSIHGNDGYLVRQHPGGKIDTSTLTEEVRQSQKPMLYLICEDALNIGELFTEKAIKLTWFVRVKHHFPNWENVLSAAEQVSQNWIIEEEHRSWPLLLTQYAACWVLSRILLCDAEDSTLAYDTLQEWRQRGVNIITHHPSIIWVTSDKFFRFLREENVK